jgi:hypothetical protein
MPALADLQGQPGGAANSVVARPQLGYLGHGHRRFASWHLPTIPAGSDFEMKPACTHHPNGHYGRI